jgi:hypothetical protein
VAQQDFQDRLQRLGAAKEAAPRPSAQSPEKRGSLVGWFLGGVQGFLTQSALIFLNANYDRFLADAKEVPEVGLLFFGLIGFLGLSLLIFTFGVLRRLISGKARQKGWGPVLGFLLGLAVATVAMGIAGQ